MDEWPYWMLEENINIVNEIIEEEEIVEYAKKTSFEITKDL